MISMPPSVVPAISAVTSRRVLNSPWKQCDAVRLRRWLVAPSCLIAFLLFAVPDCAQQSLQVLHHHIRPAVSNGQAAKVGSLPSDQRMSLSIVLPLRNQSALTSLLAQIYDQSSPNYRHFLSVGQFTKQFGPTAEDYQAVVEFAQAKGFTVTGTPANRLIVPISGSVAQVEAAFNVRMNNYQHPTEKRTFFSPDREPSLILSVQVAHIAGLNNYSIPRPMVTKATTAQGPVNSAVVGSGPGGAYLASDMRAAYYTGTLPMGQTPLNGTGQTVGLVEFDGYNITDVVSSFDGTATSGTDGSNNVVAYTPTAGGTTYNVPVNNVLLDGTTGASVSGNDSEEVLDIVQAIGMAPGLSQVRAYIGSSDSDILNAIASEGVAQQVSISWSWNPEDPEVDDFFFQEMAAQGQSIFAATGDDGAYNTQLPNFFPAEDAFVTAVGGTSLTTNGSGGAWSAETAWIGSGGGPSPDLILLPAWQNGIATSANQASTSYRNVPDVAMEADYDNYSCNMGQCQGGWAGTSFAAIRWAGYMALLNEQAAEQFQPALGFLNPLLYTIGQGPEYTTSFHDIVSGNNDITGWTPSYNAVPGYDLTTGWGSPAGITLINTMTPAQQNGFRLVLSAVTLTVPPGSSATTTITVQSLGDFSSPVTLSAPGLPSGITAVFSVDTTSTSSVLTLTTDPQMPRGSFLLNIIGTASGQSASCEVAVEINAPGFMLSGANIANGNPYVGITPGYADSLLLNLSDFAGYSGSPALSVTSPLPSGVTAILNPNTISSTNVLTFMADNNAQLSSGSAIQIAATDGTASDTRTVFMDVTAAQYRLLATPRPTSLTQGNSVNLTVTTIPWGNFAGGTINLSAFTAGFPLPNGITISFNPSTILFGQTSTMTITASPTAAPGGFYASVVSNVDNPNLSPWEAFWVTVSATPQPSFRVAVDSPYFALQQGGSFTDTMTIIDESNVPGSVFYLEPPNADNEFQLLIQNPDPSTEIGTITYDANSTTPPKLYDSTGYAFAAQDSSIQGLIDEWILVTPTTPFTLNTPTSALTLAPGGTAEAPISISLQNGFSGSVSLNSAGLPNGLTASFSSNPTAGDCMLTVVADASVSSGSYYVNISATAEGQTLVRTVFLQVNSLAPTINWATPAAITYGTPLSGTQLNASSTVAGSFTYSPAAGTVLTAGQQTLTAAFTPTATTDYTTATASVTLTVNKATPAITWATPAAITYGTTLSATQLNASSLVAGSFTYSPAAGTLLNAGAQTLTVNFAPVDSTDYATASASVSIIVNRAKPRRRSPGPHP